MRTVGLLLAALLLLAGPAAAAPYYNSSEPGCDGSDPNVLLCDDFETTEDGAIWYSDGTAQAPISCDAAGNLPGGLLAHNKGWCGKSRSPISPSGAGVCGGVGAAGTNCAASQGQQNGSVGGMNNADHTLKGEVGVSTIYVRFYKWFSPGFRFGYEKMLSFNRPGLNTAGIFFGHLKIRGAQSGSLPTTAGIDFEISNNVEDGHRGYNVSALNYTGGNWYAFEIRITLESVGGTARNGTLEIWSDNCGPNGRACPAVPTLRARYADVHFRSQGSGNELIGNLWFENWGNLGSIGESRLDQIKVSRVGPIGYVGGGSTPPPVTTTYTLTATSSGAGTVTGAGSYPSGSVVTPVALAAAGSTFSAWSGDCTGTGTCTVTMTANKAVTATFTETPPPTTSLPPAPWGATVALGTQDATGATFNVSWPAVATATSYSYTAGLSDNSANLQGAVTPPNLLLKMPYLQNGAAGSGFVCLKSVNAAGSSAEAACNSLQIPAKPSVIPPPLTTGTLTVDAQITRCNYFLTAEPPDATGGWVAQFYRDGSNKVGNPITAAPYKRSVELYAPSHSFSVQFTKTGSVMRSPAVVTRACP